MTYRDMAFGDDLQMRSMNADKTMLQSLVAGQSPVMKFWFIVMVVNLAMFLFIIR